MEEEEEEKDEAEGLQTPKDAETKRERTEVGSDL